MSEPSDSSPEASASPSLGAPDVSPGGSGTPDPAPATPPPALPDDLPPQLVQQGWRKFWSKRENRPYFWNKLSGESMWELPPIKTEFDPLTDPLGICHNSTVLVNSPTPSKRRSSEESGPPPKKFVVSGPWDLEITTNVVICERLHSQYLHPHPEIEALRFTLTNKLRQCFQELCHARESIDAPKDAFNRWLMERKVNEQNGIDPLLPSNCYPEVSHSLYEEIMNDIPIKICQPKFTGDARKQLSRYAEAAKKMIESRNASPESRKVVKWNAEDTFQWLRKTVGATYDDFQDRLEHLKKQCQPHLAETVKGSVEGICLKLYHLSCEYARKINERHLRLLNEHGLEPPQMPPIQEALSERRVWSSPCMPRGPLPPRPPHLEQYVDRELAIIKHHNEPVAIHHLYLQKLEWLYRVWGGGAGSGAAWSPSRAFCVARRYLAYCGPSTTTSPLLSLPAAVLHSLHHHFHVTFECFSTPFTSFYRQYCSPFPDTDGYYGSIGPWCESRVCSGSLVALLPGPGCGEAGEAAARHCEALLEAAESSGAALALVVVVRECEEGAGRSSLAAFLRSRHRRRHLTLPPPSHYYVAHHLHHPPTAPHLHHPAQPSALLWLQTTAAHARTPPTDDRVDALLDAWRVPAAAPSPSPAPAAAATAAPPHVLQQAAVAPANTPAAAPSPAPASAPPPAPTTPTLSPASANPLLSAAPTSNIATTTQNHLSVNTTTCT